MPHRSKHLLSASQQALLDGGSLRPIRSDERQRFDQLLIQEHCFHNASLVGGQLRCVAEFAASAQAWGRMLLCFEGLPDWRRRRGAYRLASLVATAVCAALCGVHRGQRDLAAFAANLTPAQMAALRQQAANDAAGLLRCHGCWKRTKSPLTRNRLQTVLVALMRNPRPDHTAGGCLLDRGKCPWSTYEKLKRPQ